VPLRDEAPGAASSAGAWALPWRVPAFRALMQVFVLNGVASAVPATLVIFFIQDRLQAPAWEPAFLGAYFAAGALSMPLWVRAVGRFGLLRCWAAGMGLAVMAFVWAARLGSGDSTTFLLICLASGAALGADLAVPGALLAGVIRRAGHALQHEGSYFGWWTCANKLNLALAAGLALPALQALGYTPGARDEAALASLALIYAALPCALKAAAAALLWHHRHRLDPP
jgi:Na+/melibiose symporter-like transporter